MSNFGDRLKELMIEENISPIQLSEIIKVDITTVRRWMSSQRSISLSNILLLADCFKCSLEYLAGRTDTKLDYTPHACPTFYVSLRKVMAAKGLTRYYITKNTHFKDKYFSKWKNGSDPHLETLIELSIILKCTIDYLVGREH